MLTLDLDGASYGEGLDRPLECSPRKRTKSVSLPRGATEVTKKAAFGASTGGRRRGAPRPARGRVATSGAVAGQARGGANEPAKKKKKEGKERRGQEGKDTN